VVIIDVLRRAGAEVMVASVEGSLEVLCSRCVMLVADVLITDVADSEFDCIACPVSHTVSNNVFPEPPKTK